jgi:hypothetical protein
MTEDQDQATWNVTEWHGRVLVDRNGEKIGKLQDVYVDVETDEPQFGTVKEGFIDRHLTFVPLGRLQIGPDNLQVTVTKDQVRSTPDCGKNGPAAGARRIRRDARTPLVVRPMQAVSASPRRAPRSIFAAHPF